MLKQILDRLFGRPPQVEVEDVQVRLRRGQLDPPHEGEAYFIDVSNTSAEAQVTVAHVWVETPTRLSVYTTPLPVTIEPGQQWTTWIETRELPPATDEAEHFACVALADGRIVASEPAEAED